MVPGRDATVFNVLHSPCLFRDPSRIPLPRNDHASWGKPETAFGGATAGTLLATYRGHSVPFYAASMGANYAFGSFAFFGGWCVFFAFDF